MLLLLTLQIIKKEKRSMTKSDAIKELLDKIYNYSDKLIITRKEIKQVEKYYIENQNQHIAIKTFLQSNEKTEMIVGSATFNKRTENCYCEENGWQTHYCYVDIEPVTLTWDELKLTENGIEHGYIARNVNDSSVKTFTFRYCTALTNIVIPNSITSMETGVFEYCTAITNITIPNSITSISDSAFFQCYALKEITIPNSITSIGSGAFCECLNLKNIVFAGTMEEWNNITKGEGWNKTCPAIKVTCTNGTISIPANNFDSYS